MTAIVGVLNSQGIAIAADSAVTVTGNNGRKVYNRSNKIFTLSKIHPVGIAIYNSASYLGVPLETLIKIYRRRLHEKSFDTVEEYKNDFLGFLKTVISTVNPEMKKNSFFSFCSDAFSAIIKNISDKLESRIDEIKQMEIPVRKAHYESEIATVLEDYSDFLAGYDQATYVDVKFEGYCAHYANELDEIIVYIEREVQKKFSDLLLTNEHKGSIKGILYALVNIEYLFERYCGLVFIGFGEEEMYPSSHLVLVGSVIIDTPRIRVFDSVQIIPGVLDSNILPYAQGDVTTTVLTGVDPNYKDEVKASVRSAFFSAASEISDVLNPDQRQQVEKAMNTIADELIQKLDDYQFSKITGPLLEILANMGKEDMSELAESLVNITSLKRKFSSSDSSDESVGGPVDVAIITKGDGFIWMKRKHYFDIEINKGFMERYYKM